MRLKFTVTLTKDERDALEQIVSKGTGAARTLTRARILLKVDEGRFGPASSDEEVVDALDTSASTVYRVRQRFVTEGFETALYDKKPERVYVRRLDGAGEARLVTLACSQPPEGRRRWTMRLLADRLVQLGVVSSISHEAVRTTLKKTNSSRGARRSG